MAVSGVESVGAITYARLVNDIPLEKLYALWVARGFDEKLLPPPATHENTLRRALVATRHGMRTLLRPLEGRNGFALVSETAKDDKLDYDTSKMLRARVDAPENEPVQLTITPSDHPYATGIRAQFEALQHTISAHSFGSGWLWRYIAPRCQAVSLRDFGGIYFIPRGMLAQWNAWSDTIEEACPGVKIYRIPAVSGAEAIEAVMDSVRAEAEAAIAAINEELLRTGKDALGKRALRNREQRTREVRDKIAHYEGLFEIQLDDLRGQLDSLNTEIGGALLLLAEDLGLVGGQDNE